MLRGFYMGFLAPGSGTRGVSWGNWDAGERGGGALVCAVWCFGALVEGVEGVEGGLLG